VRIFSEGEPDLLITYGRIYRANKYIMRTLSTQQINKLNKAKKDLKIIECVLDEALSNKEKYEEIQDWITKNAIGIPESLKPYMKNLFKVAKRGNIVTPEKTNAWLMKNKIENNEIVPIAQPHDMCNDYGELFKFLSEAKCLIKSKQNTCLKYKIVFGYFLQRFCEKHLNEHICGRTDTSLKNILSEQFDISISRGNRLRWLGKLGFKYRKLMDVSISLHQLFRRQKQITNISKNHPELANQCK
jgi:hypothetical protein